MSHVAPVIALAALCITLLVGLFSIGRRQGRVVTRGWPLVTLGLGLLLFGSVLEHTEGFGLEYNHFINQPIVRILLQEMVGYCGGFLIMTLGLVRWRSAFMNARAANRAKLVQGIFAQHSPQELLTSIFRSSLSGIVILKAVRDSVGVINDFEIQLLNSAAENILGRSIDTLVGKRFLTQFPCLKEHGMLDEANAVIKTSLPFHDERLMTLDGKQRWYQMAAVKLSDGLAVTFADTTDRKRIEDQLKHAANHDPLTGLANRAKFIRRVEQAINRSQRVQTYCFALLFLDFDRFKVINDSLGHDIGDQLLKGIAERLNANLRLIDTAGRFEQDHLPARLGGDEFVILLEGVKSIEDAATVAKRLQEELAAPHDLSGHEIVSTASIGVVFSNGNYTSADDVIRDADTAMYQAKSQGKARYVLFDDAMHEEADRRVTLERDLREAAENNAFSLVYEPIIALESGEVRAFEALVRWPHPTLGLICPDDFISVAEEIGLIVQIGGWVLDSAAQTLTRWQQEHPKDPPLSLHVNLSRQQLQHPCLIQSIRELRQRHSFVDGSIVLEITESMIMSDTERLLPVFKDLKSLGVRIAMDDFGTGHSSLSCLHQLPIDIVKIDRSFIGNAGAKRDYAAIVQAIVELAHNLDLTVVAEGVEQLDRLTLLQALDCEFAQGHLISQPLSLEEAEQMLNNGFQFKCAA